MSAYYNENDPNAAAWLQELISEGLIADGVVDDRSIKDVEPKDLSGFNQCHFFAGIGGWSLALRLAGVADDAPVWTGSCPCQPFSAAGKKKGVDDDRHLWPAWLSLIQECRPPIVFGEQVANAIKHGWLDSVSDDLEEQGYAFGASVLPACSVGAPHLRQRAWFVAHPSSERLEGWPLESAREELSAAERGGDAVELADTRRWELEREGLQLDGASRSHEGKARKRERVRAESRASGSIGAVGDSESNDERRLRRREEGRKIKDRGRCSVGELADPESQRCGERREGVQRPTKRLGRSVANSRDPWRDSEWIACSDGKSRPVEPGVHPVAHGLPARVVRLRGYGNAIVPQVAATFIEESLGAIEERNHE